MDEISNIIQSQVEIPELFTMAYAVVRNDFGVLLSFKECFNLYNVVRMTNKIEGDILEVGTFGGGSSKLMSLFVENNKKIYTYDTYEGLKDVNENDSGFLHNGDFSHSFEEVQRRLYNNKNVILNKGYFPNCANFSEDKMFSFVHLDVDTYQSTLNCLHYVYNRLSKNGVIVSHDYNNYPTPGVRKAFDEFFKDKPEHVIPMWDTQCMIIKI